MKAIYKYNLELVDEQTISLPIGAEVISVQSQRDEICIWAIIDTSVDVEPYKFYIVGTGHPLIEDKKYLGSVQLEQGYLVFHVFMEG